jgi:uncharacterized membrane protein (UPF0127 family)
MMAVDRLAKLTAALFIGAALSACTAPGNVDAKSSAAKPCAAGTQLGESEAGLELVQLCINSGKTVRAFTTEIAATSREQAMGMMFRKSLGDNAGMIFPFPEPRQAGFWMKNTVIPLDIIFIRADGTIESISENAVPYSEESIESGEAVAAVLELRGGLTRQLGIKAGDVVHWK